MREARPTALRENQIVKLDEELVSAVEKFVADQKEPPAGPLTFGAAVNVIVRDWLQSQGYMPLPEAHGEIRRAPDAARVPKS